MVVPRKDGMVPPHWPAGFERGALIAGPIADVDALLADDGLPNGAGAGGLVQRRNALAAHIGTTLV